MNNGVTITELMPETFILEFTEAGAKKMPFSRTSNQF